MLKHSDTQKIISMFFSSFSLSSEIICPTLKTDYVWGFCSETDTMQVY